MPLNGFPMKMSMDGFGEETCIQGRGQMVLTSFLRPYRQNVLPSDHGPPWRGVALSEAG